MTAFDTAWELFKTDMRFPTGRPSFIDPYANLTVHGSRIPDHVAYWRGDNPIIPPEKFNMNSMMESVKHELERRRGERVFAPVVDYEVGDFGDNMKDGLIDQAFSYRNPNDEPRLFKTPKEMGAEIVINELERASLINALNDAGIFDEKSLENILDEAFQYMDAGIAPYSYQGKRMDNDKGEYMIRRLK